MNTVLFAGSLVLQEDADFLFQYPLIGLILTALELIQVTAVAHVLQNFLFP